MSTRVETEKILIVKPGYSETLDPDTSGIVSLGDVLRSTPILHAFDNPNQHVTWMVDERGYPLLRGNDKIDAIIKINEFTPFRLMREHFDIVVNLEKDPGICALADLIPARRKYGFGFDTSTGRIFAHPNAERALHLAHDPETKYQSQESWLSVLFGILGLQYNGEAYVLGHVPEIQDSHDIGLNFRVGSKFPFKAWPQKYWQALHDQLSDTLDVVWQPSSDDVEHIENYIDWIGNCRLLVTNDSLGLHIALALGKAVVALFGPTSASEIHNAPNLVKVTPKKSCECQPLYVSQCQQKTACISTIGVEQVVDAVNSLLSGSKVTQRRVG